MSPTIERESPTPYYEQLFTILRDRIARGDIPAGERLDSELELCREFGLSRATVRQTMSKLETEGYARRVARRGVFASAPGQSTGWTVQEGFLESQIRHGRTDVDTRVIDARFVIPPQHVADKLQIDPTEKVFALQRVRSLDGQVAMFSTNWFPQDIGPIIAEAQNVISGNASVNSTLRAAGFRTSGASRTIHALQAPMSIAAHLQVDPGFPVLRVRSLSWDQQGKRFDYYETWVLTEIIPLEVNVSAT